MQVIKQNQESSRILVNLIDKSLDDLNEKISQIDQLVASKNFIIESSYNYNVRQLDVYIAKCKDQTNQKIEEKYEQLKTQIFKEINLQYQAEKIDFSSQILRERNKLCSMCEIIQKYKEEPNKEDLSQKLKNKCKKHLKYIYQNEINDQYKKQIEQYESKTFKITAYSIKTNKIAQSIDYYDPEELFRTETITNNLKVKTKSELDQQQLQKTKQSEIFEEFKRQKHQRKQSKLKQKSLKQHTRISKIDNLEKLILSKKELLKNIS